MTITHITKPPLEAVLCGRCNSADGCGYDDTYMYCHKEIGMCVCRKGYWPNKEGTACTEKNEEPWDFNQCLDVKPDVIDHICPADKCGENEVCKIVQVGDLFRPKCVCAAGFEFDQSTGACVGADDGKCSKNTDCNIDGNEKCDKFGTKRCVCRDGFMRQGDVCVKACGIYQDFNFDIKPLEMTDAQLEMEKPDMEYPDKENMAAVMEKYAKYMKPRICDPNATCVTKEIYGREVQACECNKGFMGDGCECWSKEKCQAMCDKRMPGSSCVADPSSDYFTCRCGRDQEMMKYDDGTPCCVTRPRCETQEDCRDMGEGAFCFPDAGCLCKSPFVMSKEQKCVDPKDNDYDDNNDDDDDDVVTDPCAGVRCEKNAHCEISATKEPKCVCNDGFVGKDGRNCVSAERECTFGSCVGVDYDNSYKPDFMVKPGQTCGHEKMNLVCQKDGCCDCERGWSDADGNFKTGCEFRQNPCKGDTICSKFADCIDIETGMEEYEFTEKPDVEYARKEAMELEIEAIPILPLGYKCKCREGYIGNGIGPQGCRKPDSELVNECNSIKNPCGRNSECTDLPVGFECDCIKGFKSLTNDGRNCIDPDNIPEPVKPKPDPENPNPCDGFCMLSKKNPDCHLRDLSAFHTKITDYMVMNGDATTGVLPGVAMTVVTKKTGWPLNRSKYSAFLGLKQDRCGNALISAILAGDVKVSIMDKAGEDGTSVYRIDGIQGYSSKTAANSRAWSGLVIQFTKKFNTLAEATGNAEDFEMNQFLKTMKDGSIKTMPNYDSFQLIFTGKDVTPEVMGKDNFKSCFNVREGAPFSFELWDEREEGYDWTQGDSEEKREHLVTLKKDFTKCWLKYKTSGKNIQTLQCKEPLVDEVGNILIKEPTFLDKIEQAGKRDVVCTAV